jgi:hypothetical protein
MGLNMTGWQPPQPDQPQSGPEYPPPYGQAQPGPSYTPQPAQPYGMAQPWQQAVQQAQPGPAYPSWTQDKRVRRGAIAGVVMVIAGLLIQHASWLISWQAADGTTYTVYQMHEMCSSPLAQYAAEIAGPAAGCSAMSSWWDFSGALFVGAVAAFAIVGYRIYQIKAPRRVAQQGA